MLHRHIHRTYVPGGIYFVTTDVRNHVPMFANPEIAAIVEHSIWHKRASSFVVYAYVVMPDHLHLLLQPIRRNISIIMQSIKSNSCREINRYLNQHHSGERALAAMGGHGTFQWQKGFYDHVEYIRYNPVKAGLVEEPRDYPFLFVDEEAIGKVLAGS